VQAATARSRRSIRKADCSKAGTGVAISVNGEHLGGFTRSAAHA
jgi:hypothetical protein